MRIGYLHFCPDSDEGRLYLSNKAKMKGCICLCQALQDALLAKLKFYAACDAQGRFCLPNYRRENDAIISLRAVNLHAVVGFMRALHSPHSATLTQEDRHGKRWQNDEARFGKREKELNYGK